jgi:predicted PurR-regulated permease PerM
MARLTDPPPPRSPLLLPPPRPQPPPPSPALQQRAWAALALALLSLLAMTLISNIHRGVYVAVVALVLAFGSMSAARKAGTRRPRGAVAAAVLGLIGAVFCGFALAGFLIFHTELSQYATCMSGANTTATRTACQNQLDNSVRNEIKLLGGN